MSNIDRNETQSPDIIEEIIPGKNGVYNNKYINQDNNKSPIENYNEKEAVQTVLEASEEYDRNLEKSTVK